MTKCLRNLSMTIPFFLKWLYSIEYTDALYHNLLDDFPVGKQKISRKISSGRKTIEGVVFTLVGRLERAEGDTEAARALVHTWSSGHIL